MQEFAWVSMGIGKNALIETRISTRLGQNVMLLTYVSIFYLPLAFCAVSDPALLDIIVIEVPSIERILMELYGSIGNLGRSKYY
jgi:hypothetical protein